MRDTFRFTVFTPTYNRAHTLPRVYAALLSQTFKDFEWVIIDDGSTDDTRSLIESWKAEARIPIQYYLQSNSRKHVAFNRGVELARGELFVPLDSDDTCVPEALQRFDFHWRNVAEDERDGYSGISCLCCDEQGKLIGDRYPSHLLDGNWLEMVTRHGISGEKWGVTRTDILRKCPFPEFPGERVPDSLIWNRIAVRYRMRFINEPLRVYHQSSDSVSADLIGARIRSPNGTRFYYREYAQLPIGFKFRLRGAINYYRFAMHAGTPLLSAWQGSGCRLLGVIAAPVGYASYLHDCRKLGPRPTAHGEIKR